MVCLKYSAPRSRWIVTAILTLSSFRGNSGGRPTSSSSLFMMTMADAYCEEMTCQNGATCVEGGHPGFEAHPKAWDGQSFPFHMAESSASETAHCVCAPGFTGLFCEQTMQVCAEASDVNGNVTWKHVCYNGGRCVDAPDDQGPTNLHVCDCTEAMNVEKGLRYVGKFCEQKIPLFEEDPKIICTPSGPKGANGCLSGGKCHSSPDGRSRCTCQRDFKGRHCEFHKSTVPTDCNLGCQNGGTCEIGFRHPTSKAESSEFFLHLDRDDLHQNMMHCECPTGFVGRGCEIEAIPCGMLTRFENAGSSPLFCFHGSKCVRSVNSAGQEESHCDCNTAHTTTTSFGGIGCQYEASAFCTKKPSLNGHKICVNGGTCQRDEGDGMDANIHCRCPKGFHGDSCEFPDALQHTQEYRDRPCSLKCENNGTCIKGIKDYGLLNQHGNSGDQHLDHIMQQRPDVQSWHDAVSANGGISAVEHCSCPDGFTGLFCQHQARICGQNLHVCFHGSACVEGDDGRYSCDCAASDKLVAGKYCQYNATEICDESDKQFCVNFNGKCPGRGKQCACNNGYGGAHCEYSVQELETTNTVPNTNPNHSPVRTVHTDRSSSPGKYGRNVFISLMCVIAIGFILVVGVVVWTNRANQMEKMTSDPQTAPLAVGAATDDDDNNNNSTKKTLDSNRRSPPSVAFSSGSLREMVMDDAIPPTLL